MTYTLYSGSGVKSENLVGSDMSQKYILGVLEHIFNSMGDGEKKTLTILATQSEGDYEVEEKEDYISSSDDYDGLFDDEDEEGGTGEDPEDTEGY